MNVGSASRYPVAQDLDALRRNLAAVRARIDAACARVGRDPAEVRLLPVSKTVTEDRIRLAYAAGCHELGENRVQEAQRKATAMADLDGLRWSIIGHLQSNKVRAMVRFASEFQSLDSLRIAAALDRQLQIEGRSLDVLVQVNTSGEASKFGLPPQDVAGFIRLLPPFTALRIRGLMTLAVLLGDPARVRPCFTRLRELRERLCQEAPCGIGMSELSMGMSGDFELAIEEGATVVRVGQAIFGHRTTPDSHYWPGSDPAAA